MNKKIQRLWLSRLQRFPQTAAQRMSTLFHRIPQKVRFAMIATVFALVTAISASHFPLSIVPLYRTGDVVESDVVIPANLMSGNDPRAVSVPAQFKRNPILLHAGEIVTPEKVPVIEAIRSFQLAQRNPKRLLGLLALIGLMFFGLYKAALTSQSSRLGPRTAFWVSTSALMIQTLLVRLGMFGAAVLGAGRDRCSKRTSTWPAACTAAAAALGSACSGRVSAMTVAPSDSKVRTSAGPMNSPACVSRTRWPSSRVDVMLWSSNQGRVSR